MIKSLELQDNSPGYLGGSVVTTEVLIRGMQEV